MEQIELLFLFFTIAAVYSSAGFGGGSSYLAILSLFSIPMETLRPTALLCNLVVVTGNLIIFYRAGLLDLRRSLPLVSAGIPLAFIGGYWKLSERTFFILLGASLVIAAIAMWLQNRRTEKLAQVTHLSPAVNAGLGGGLGLLAGLTGIGGGIFLAPILHLIRWDTAKTIAAAASLFIFCQSAAGLAGQLARQRAFDVLFVLPLLAAVWLGGQLGARWSAIRLPAILVRNITALLVFYAGVNILWRNI